MRVVNKIRSLLNKDIFLSFNKYTEYVEIIVYNDLLMIYILNDLIPYR